MNIVLIGYRGTGKTDVGKRVAAALGRNYVGLDAEIVTLAGKPIPDIVADSGWDHFRDLESEVVRQAAEKDNCVLDTGGGAILRQENVDALKENGVLFWIQATISDIVTRIGGDDQRPSLTGAKSFTEEVEEVLAERTPKYAAAADHIIEPTLTDLDAITRRIVETVSV